MCSSTMVEEEGRSYRWLEGGDVHSLAQRCFGSAPYSGDAPRCGRSNVSLWRRPIDLSARRMPWRRTLGSLGCRHMRARQGMMMAEGLEHVTN